MGDIIKVYDFAKKDSRSFMKPIIYCNLPEGIKESAIPVNLLIARELQKQSSPTMRTMKMETNMLHVISKLGDVPVLSEFDVLFNPSYKLDVIKLLINVCRKKQFSAIWPGRYENGKLYYAEEGYRDYKVFDIEDYDITVIV